MKSALVSAWNWMCSLLKINILKRNKSKWKCFEGSSSLVLWKFYMILGHSLLYTEPKILWKIFVIWTNLRPNLNYQKGLLVSNWFKNIKIIVFFFIIYHSNISYILLAKCASFFVWGGAIIIGTLLAILMTVLVWNRSQTTPTLTTIDTYYHPIWNVPFPAITLCNLNAVYRPAFDKLTEKWFVTWKSKENAFKLICLWCRQAAGFNSSIIKKGTTRLNAFAQHKDLSHDDWFEAYRLARLHFNATVEQILHDVMQPCENMVKQCLWLNKIVPCNELFQISITSLGFCCLFQCPVTVLFVANNNIIVIIGSFNYLGTAK